MNTVKVIKSKDGEVVVALPQSAKAKEAGKTFGYVRVEQKVKTFKNNFQSSQVRRALIVGELEELQEDYVEGSVLQGKLVVKERTTPWHSKNPQKIHGGTGQPIFSNGQPVFRQVFFTQNLNDFDEILPIDPPKTEEESEEVEEAAPF